MTPQELCQQAAAALQRGHPAEAERLAADVLKLAPRDFAALRIKGIAHFQLGKLPSALEAMQAAVQVNGAVAPAWSNLGSMQLAADDKPGALASFERALVLGPPQAELLCNVGNLLIELNRVDEAIPRYDAALALNPGLAQALIGRANALQLLLRFTESLADCDRALALSPGHPGALNNKAASLLGLSRFADALAAADGSLAARPGDPGALTNRASALLGLRRNDEALAACDQALALAPNHLEALCNRGSALSTLDRQAEALAVFDRVLALDPRMTDALLNRVTPLRHLERYEEALASTGRAMVTGVASPPMLRARAMVLADLGRGREAHAALDGALALAPHDADTLFHKGQFLMRDGDFAAGLPLYEARKRMDPPFGAKTFAQPLWTGVEDLTGKTIFLHWEQGLGDVFMFSRYVAPLAERGARVILSVPGRLRALFDGFQFPAQIIGDGVPDRFDYHLPLAGVMLALGTTPDTIPASPAYLTADAERVARWGARIGGHGFKIGVAWQGASDRVGAGRSFPVALLRDIAALDGVRLIALQKGAGTEQLAALPPGMMVETLGADFDSGPDAFVDTAAAMQACDLIISSDTSTAHLAGALGRPVWIALRHGAEWRWLSQRRDTPWYPTAKLFRQPSAGDWTGVFAAMREELQQSRLTAPGA